jgi:rhamnogalacturonan endolyase
VAAVGDGLARQMEDLDRGVIALRRATNQVYVGWRMLGTDPTSVAFNLYRSTNGTRVVKLNSSPITQTTDYVDSTATMSVPNTYFVRPIIAGIELAPSESFTLAANSPVNQFLNVPLQIPTGGTTPSGEAYTYSANDASVGDLDGDGQYEILLKWDPSNSKDNSQSGYTGNVYVDAYKLDGTLLWRIDLGRNIRAGAHYTQFMVYDLDGDGRAEVAMKTAPGTLDGQGNAVLLGSDSVSADYRNSSGYIITGPEYLTVFNGETGAAMATIPFEPARGTASQWGDDYGNRVDRFLGGIAYSDGVRPSLVMARGYYGPRSSSGQARNEIAAYDFRDGQLTLRWHFKAGYNINGNINSNYIGQGTHSLSIADVDGDGFDEVIYGAAAIDHDGTGLYSTGLGHGDALHVSDMIPDRPGLEVFMPHEGADGNGNVGASIRDAATGELIFTINSTGDVGRGAAADIDPNHAGYEFWASTTYEGETRQVYDTAGDPIYEQGNIFSNFLVWWDADLSRELLDGTTIANWNNPGRSNFDLDPGTSGTQQYAPNGSSNNGTKSTPALTADIFGDWREEVIWRRSDNTALMIFSTIIPATNRLTTLMHDSQYRVAIAWQNTAYNQPPHPSFYLGAGMTVPPQPNIYLASANPIIPGDFDLDDDVDQDDLAIWQQTSGTSQTQGYLPGDADGDGTVGGRDFLIWQRNYGQSRASSVAAALQSDRAPEIPSASSSSDLGDESLRDEAFAFLLFPNSDKPQTRVAFEDLDLLVDTSSSSNEVRTVLNCDIEVVEYAAQYKRATNSTATTPDSIDEALLLLTSELAPVALI